MLRYAPSVPTAADATRQDFDMADGLVILSNAQNAPRLQIALRGRSTYNSDISYDGKVNLAELGILNARFGLRAGDAAWDPTADVNGDGRINLADLGLFNAEFGRGIGSASSGGRVPPRAVERPSAAAVAEGPRAVQAVPAGARNESSRTPEPQASRPVTPDAAAKLLPSSGGVLWALHRAAPASTVSAEPPRAGANETFHVTSAHVTSTRRSARGAAAARAAFMLPGLLASGRPPFMAVAKGALDSRAIDAVFASLDTDMQDDLGADAFWSRYGITARLSAPWEPASYGSGGAAR